MIMFSLKCSIALIVSFLIFSFQIGNKTIFDHITEVTGPIGSKVQHSLKDNIEQSYKKSKEIGAEFFQNGTAKQSDHISSKRSSVGKSKKDLERLHQKEIEELDKVIRENK